MLEEGHPSAVAGGLDERVGATPSGRRRRMAARWEAAACLASLRNARRRAVLYANGRVHDPIG